MGTFITSFFRIKCPHVMRLIGQYFDKRLYPIISTQPTLPFFHCCDARFLQFILEDRQLKPRKCKVFGMEELLYLFYGRPAYKNAEEKHGNLFVNMPVCFIIKSDAVHTIKRVIPFDSGGFSHYGNHIHKDMKLEEFFITPEKSALSQVVESFYDDNAQYFNGKAKAEVTFDPMHFQLEVYHSLIKTSALEEADDRKRSIEVQIDYPIELSKSNIELIIMPEYLISSSIVQDILIKELGIQIEGITNFGVASSCYYTHVLTIAQQHLKSNNLLYGK